MSTTPRGEVAAETAGFRPSRTLRALNHVSTAYRQLFAESRIAPWLSQAKPIRRTGFELELQIKQVRQEADEVVSLTLADPGGAKLPRWIPGAHLDVLLPSGRHRQYSLCGDPGDRHEYRIAIRRIDDGDGGSREIHHELRAGETITVRGPRNAFRLVAAPSYLFVAGGIGITPILPMVRHCDTQGLPWRLVYLSRTRSAMPFLGELTGMRTGTIDIRTDDEDGRPDVESILPFAQPAAAIYMCGPAPLMATAREALPRLNPSASLHTERFSPPPVRGGSPFDIRLRRTGRTVTVGAEESALTAVRRQVPEAAYSCRQGFCGTCRVRVLHGDVAHRDHRLTERQRQDSMLICVSRSSGGTLELDL